LESSVEEIAGKAQKDGSRKENLDLCAKGGSKSEGGRRQETKSERAKWWSLEKKAARLKR
jgi:hypothetical protein